MKFVIGRRIFEWLFLSLFLISCSDDGDQPLPSTNILTLTIGSNRFASGSENWIFITTEDGELMDVKQVANGQAVNFTSTIDASKLNLTWLEHTQIPSSSGSNDLFFNFITFLDIAKGSEIVWQNNPQGQQGLFSIENVQLTVSNYFESDVPMATLALSNGIDFPLTQSKIISPVFTNNVFTANIPLIFDPGSNISSLFIAGYRGITPVFSFPANVPNNGSIDIDFNDFEEFDHVIDVSGAIDAGIVGQLNNNGNPRRYVLSGISLLFLTPQVFGPKRIAYNDGFDSYNTFVIGSNFRYFKNGAAPATFEMPQTTPAIQVLSGSMQNFDFTVSNDYSFYRAGWFEVKGNNIMQWTAIGGSGVRFRMNAIPPELGAEFPGLTTDLKFGSVTITKYLTNFTFADQLDKLFLFKNLEAEEFWMFESN